MTEHPNPGSRRDSLEVVELMMAVEQAIDDDSSLSPGQKERLVREIEARIESGAFRDDDLDDDAASILVHKLGPGGPYGQGSAKVKPEDAFG